MQKYELTNDCITFKGRTLFRIRAIRNFKGVKIGDLGGYVEKEDNLSHYGSAWVYDNACIYGNAHISGNARISGNACIFDNAFVFDNVCVSGNAQILGDACISGNALIYGNAHISVNAWVYDNAHIYGDARIYGNAHIFGNAQVYGNANIYGTADISGNACIYSQNGYLCFLGLGPQNLNTTFFKCVDGHIYVCCRRFLGTIQDFENKVKKTRGNPQYVKECLACLPFVKIHFEEGMK